MIQALLRVLIGFLPGMLLGGLDYRIATIVSFSLEWLWLFGYSSPIKKTTPIIENRILKQGNSL